MVIDLVATNTEDGEPTHQNVMIVYRKKTGRFLPSPEVRIVAMDWTCDSILSSDSALDNRCDYWYRSIGALNDHTAHPHSEDDFVRREVYQARADLNEAARLCTVPLDEAYQYILTRLLCRVNEFNDANAQKPALRSKHHPNPSANSAYYSPKQAEQSLVAELAIVKGLMGNNTATGRPATGTVRIVTDAEQYAEDQQTGTTEYKFRGKLFGTWPTEGRLSCNEEEDTDDE